MDFLWIVTYAQLFFLVQPIDYLCENGFLCKASSALLMSQIKEAIK